MLLMMRRDAASVIAWIAVVGRKTTGLGPCRTGALLAPEREADARIFGVVVSGAGCSRKY
jgi:hypothetical protein